jgi:hypothetical protein
VTEPEFDSMQSDERTDILLAAMEIYTGSLPSASRIIPANKAYSLLTSLDVVRIW